MRGMIMTSDAMIASFIVLLIVLLWVQMQVPLISGEVEEVKIEARKARVLVLSDWLAKAVLEEGAGGSLEEKFVNAAARFGVSKAQKKVWKVGEGKSHAGERDEKICIRRVVALEGGAWVVEVCA